MHATAQQRTDVIRTCRANHNSVQYWEHWQYWQHWQHWQYLEVFGSIGSSSLEDRSLAPDMSESLLADQFLLGHDFHGEYIVSALLHHLDDCAETALAKHLKTTTSGVSTAALMCKGGSCGASCLHIEQ